MDLILKFNHFLHPAGPLQQPEDHFSIQLADQVFKAAQHSPGVVCAVFLLLLYSQALLI